MRHPAGSISATTVASSVRARGNDRLATRDFRREEEVRDMTSGEKENDPLFAAIATLKTHDVQKHRADALRRRCHTELQTRSQRNASPGVLARISFRRAVGPAIALL